MIQSLLNHDPIPTHLQIEVATSFKIPSFQIVGLPSPEVSEARERIQAAFSAAHLEFPRRKIILNLSPASERKMGTGLDLPMALAIFREIHRSNEAPNLFAWGELGLSGEVRSAGQVRRALAAAVSSNAQILILPASDSENIATALEDLRQIQPEVDLRIHLVTHLAHAVHVVQNPSLSPTSIPTQLRAPESLNSIPPTTATPPPWIQKWTGIACAQDLHTLLLGPRGIGKSNALKWMDYLHPGPSPLESYEATLCYELRDEVRFQPQNRRLSHQVRPSALLGRISRGKLLPGEFSLAHGRLLLADEILEWPRDSLELLRDPLQSQEVQLTRTERTTRLPAGFTLAASANLCPCGGWQPEQRIPESWNDVCRCTLQARIRYRQKLSFALRDRIPILLRMLENPHDSASPPSSSPQKLIMKIQTSRQMALEKWGAPIGKVSPEKLELAHPRMSLMNTGSYRSIINGWRLSWSLAYWNQRKTPNPTDQLEAAAFMKKANSALLFS